MVLGLIFAASSSVFAQLVEADNNNTPINLSVARPSGMVRVQDADQIDPSIGIGQYLTACPAIESGPAVWTPWVNSVQDTLAHGTPPATNLVFDKFYPITGAFPEGWRLMCVDTTGQVGIEFGNLVPGSVQRGMGVCSPFWIISSNNVPFTLDDVIITSWLNTAGSTKVASFASYFPEALGVKADGTQVTSGATSQAVVGFQYVGYRRSFAAKDQAGLNVIKNYVNANVTSATWEVVLMRAGIVVARKQITLPFVQSNFVMGISRNGAVVLGGPNQQYQVFFSDILPGNWQSLGLPVFSGDLVPVSSSGMRFYKASQGK